MTGRGTADRGCIPRLSTPPGSPHYETPLKRGPARDQTPPYSRRHPNGQRCRKVQNRALAATAPHSPDRRAGVLFSQHAPLTAKRPHDALAIPKGLCLPRTYTEATDEHATGEGGRNLPQGRAQGTKAATHVGRPNQAALYTTRWGRRQLERRQRSNALLRLRGRAVHHPLRSL